MCWVLLGQDPLELGPVRGRTQSSFGFGCTTRPNKFGDPKALGSNPILLGPTSGPKANGSDVGTQFSWVLQDPRLMGPESEPNFGPASGLEGNGS
jgi:hypothetical protein